MRIRLGALVVVGLVLALVVFRVLSKSDNVVSAGDLSVSDAFVRATARATPEAIDGMTGTSGDPTSAVYLTIINNSERADKLLSATCDAADSATLHQTVVKNDIAQMLSVEGGLIIPAKSRVELRPGGYHLMLSQLKHDLLPDTSITLTLSFESGTRLVIKAPVRAN